MMWLVGYVAACVVGLLAAFVIGVALFVQSNRREERLEDALYTLLGATGRELSDEPSEPGRLESAVRYAIKVLQT